MKQFIFFLSLLPVFIFAQNSDAFNPDTIPPNAVRIGLPRMKYESVFDGRTYIINREADYRALFADSAQSRLPVINFERNELVSYAYCRQCLLSCGGNPGCHRDACMYIRNWYLVEKKDRVMVGAVQLNSEQCGFLPVDKEQLVCSDDSCFQQLIAICRPLSKAKVDFSREQLVAREMNADCSASFSHTFYLDSLRHCMVWRTSVADGVCQAMQLRTFVFVIPRLPEGYTVVFEEATLPEEH